MAKSSSRRAALLHQYRMAKLSCQDYGYRSQGNELPELRLNVLMNIEGDFAQQKAEEAENKSKVKTVKTNCARKQVLILFPERRPSKLYLVQNYHAP